MRGCYPRQATVRPAMDGVAANLGCCCCKGMPKMLLAVDDSRPCCKETLRVEGSGATKEDGEGGQSCMERVLRTCCKGIGRELHAVSCKARAGELERREACGRVPVLQNKGGVAAYGGHRCYQAMTHVLQVVLPSVGRAVTKGKRWWYDGWLKVLL
jgi:hypothetical protein